MSDNGATTTQGRSESSAKYKVGDEVLYAEERKRLSIELEQAIKEYGNAQKASWKPRASRDSPLPGKARLDKAMRQLEIAARKVIELGKDDAT